MQMFNLSFDHERHHYAFGLQRVDLDATGATIRMRAMRLGRTAGRA